MKSFLYEIPAEYYPLHKNDYIHRIKVFHEGTDFEIRHESVLMLMGLDWFSIYKDIYSQVHRLHEEAKASVDITPGDGCEHSDRMIID